MWQALRLGSAAQDRHVTHYACLALASATDQAPANVDRVAALVRLEGAVPPPPPPPPPRSAGAARLPGAGGEGGAGRGGGAGGLMDSGGSSGGAWLESVCGELAGGIRGRGGALSDA